MRFKIVVLILFLSLFNIPLKGVTSADSLKVGIIKFRPTYPDQWLSEDKYKHLSTSMFMYLTAFYYSAYLIEINQQRSTGISAALSLNLGLFKEIYDGRYKKNGYFSYKDLIADGLGVFLGIVITNNLAR